MKPTSGNWRASGPALLVSLLLPMMVAAQETTTTTTNADGTITTVEETTTPENHAFVRDSAQRTHVPRRFVATYG